MSVELISVLIAVLAIGATLAGLIVTSNRGLRKETRYQMASDADNNGRAFVLPQPGESSKAFHAFGHYRDHLEQCGGHRNSPKTAPRFWRQCGDPNMAGSKGSRVTMRTCPGRNARRRHSFASIGATANIDNRTNKTRDPNFREPRALYV